MRGDGQDRLTFDEDYGSVPGFWFELDRLGQRGVGEVRTYTSLIRHWFRSRRVMYFLAAQTRRLRGEKSADHAGAGGRGGERAGHGDLEKTLALAG